MFKIVLTLLIVLTNLPSITPSCVAQYDQCGGIGYTGLTECCSPSTCQVNNEYYSQCLNGTAASTSSSSSTASTSSSSSTAQVSTGCNALYSQCGGQNWSGPTCCVNSICTVVISEYYSQCLTASSSSTTISSTSTTKAPSSTTQASSSTTKPTTGTTIASTSSTAASTSTAKASSSTTQASSSTTKPTTGTTIASTSSTAASTSTAKASSSTTQASSSTTKSTTGTTIASTSSTAASTSTAKASSSTTQASSSTTKPTTGTTIASTSSTAASTSTAKASSSTTQASSSTTKPTTGTTIASTSSTAASTSTTKASSSTTQASSSTTKPTTGTTIASTSSTAASTSTAKASSSTTQASSSTTKSATSTTSSVAQSCSNVYGQCGGITWTGPTTCCTGSTCQYNSLYYSQCLPTSGASTSGTSTSGASTSSSSAATASTTSAGNVGGTPGITTRYWDCCKASCGWPGKASVTNPVKTCAQDGVTTVGVNAQSGCGTGGTAYMCNNQQPWNVSTTLSYGYAAADISGEGESNWCCACYSLIFTSTSIAGKQLIVQVTNTGGDLGNNQFDLQMPGGGFGLFDGCETQFPGPYVWGQTYGGVSQRSDCNNLPPVLQSGCFWRFDWFEDANNPTMVFTAISCPTVLTANTNCIRN